MHIEVPPHSGRVVTTVAFKGLVVRNLYQDDVGDTQTLL
ncbi:hypothetical protein BH24ACT5_BH24ACT5_15580 [soil metagenome]